MPYLFRTHSRSVNALILLALGGASTQILPGCSRDEDSSSANKDSSNQDAECTEDCEGGESSSGGGSSTGSGSSTSSGGAVGTGGLASSGGSGLGGAAGGGGTNCTASDDADGDGICGEDDLCPNDKALGPDSNENGCTDVACDADVDGDDVCDDVDLCSGVAGRNEGCPAFVTIDFTTTPPNDGVRIDSGTYPIRDVRFVVDCLPKLDDALLSIGTQASNARVFTDEAGGAADVVDNDALDDGALLFVGRSDLGVLDADFDAAFRACITTAGAVLSVHAEDGAGGGIPKESDYYGHPPWNQTAGDLSGSLANVQAVKLVVEADPVLDINYVNNGTYSVTAKVNVTFYGSALP